MNKKGVIEELGSLVVPLVAIAIVLAVSFLIFSEAKDKVVSITAVSVTQNETFTGWTTGVYQALTTTVSGNCMTMSCIIYNGSGSSITLSTASYNCTAGAGVQLNNASVTQVNESVIVQATCAPTTIAYNATGTIQNATQDIPGWLPIIVITIIGGLLIGLVAFFRR